MPKLNRRQYQELVRFLKDTIKNPSVGHRVRMSAAARLDGILSRHEYAEQQAEARKARLQLAALAAQSQEGAVLLPETASQRLARVAREVEEEERIRLSAVFGRISDKARGLTDEGE